MADALPSKRKRKADTAINDDAAKNVRSLGWLTESAMPRKREARKIDLADGNSAVQMRAAMLQAQADAKLSVNDPNFALRKRPRGGDIFRQKNAGVDERNRRDLALNQAEGSYSNEQLNAKARLYDKMKRGELNHTNSLVDFEQKGLEQMEMRTQSLEDEIERRRWEKEALMEIKTGIVLSKLRKDRPVNGVKQKYDNTLSAEQKEILSQVNAETVAARKKVSTVKDKRKALLEKRKQKLLESRRRRQKTADLFKKPQLSENKTNIVNESSIKPSTGTVHPDRASRMMEPSFDPNRPSNIPHVGQFIGHSSRQVETHSSGHSNIHPSRQSNVHPSRQSNIHPSRQSNIHPSRTSRFGGR
eukprot:CAMPEP_0167744820 /NCGR_PEP_ID=MMETSP0110_2-20121227/2805_1 /TAXON_ID=629695 /ORGANISM="Gymnochlora sp., Strain CCMP2014" /LENGTH=358 /DNA_ID=CAMNT_0007629387 /DNA_START=6 /DNA_END=1082 /DNA_ORIENTATION=+